MPYFWLAMIVLSIIIEAFTSELVSIWFVAGGITSLIVSLVGGPIWLQWLLYVAVTAVALVITRPLVKKVTKSKIVETNADRCIGKKAVVVVPINNISGTGQVKVLGNIWTARSAENALIPEGADVMIQSIEGVKLIVKPAD